MEPQWERLGVLIRRDRQRARMSQDVLAKKAHLSKRTIGSYERGGVGNPSPIPGGYYSVADVLGWTPNSVDSVLVGADEPEYVSDTPGRRHDLEALMAPVFNIADLARDAGAPADLVARFRLSAVELVKWLDTRSIGDEGLTLGPGVSPGDAERVLNAVENDAE